MTQEQKIDLLNEYNNRENKVADIALKYGVPKSEVTNIAVAMGATPRRPNYYGRRGGGKIKSCPKCYKRVTVAGAKYCCFCGSDIRSKRELLTERINKAFELIGFLPHNERDGLQTLFVDIINELKE